MRCTIVQQSSAMLDVVDSDWREPRPQTGSFTLASKAPPNVFNAGQAFKSHLQWKENKYASYSDMTME